jgi:hypothetical protein
MMDDGLAIDARLWNRSSTAAASKTGRGTPEVTIVELM